MIVAHPMLRVAVTGASALSLHNLIDRAPDVVHVAVAHGQYVPTALTRVAQVSTSASRLEPVDVRGIPVHRVASLLVLAASVPRQIGSWATIGERLGDIVAAVDRNELDIELEGRPAATLARLAYLVHGADRDLADGVFAPPTAGKAHPLIWFGPRHGGRTARTNRRFGVTDTPPVPARRYHCDQRRALSGGIHDPTDGGLHRPACAGDRRPRARSGTDHTVRAEPRRRSERRFYSVRVSPKVARNAAMHGVASQREGGCVQEEHKH